MSEDRTERRLTTILAADVVGYSRLMAADEAGTLTSLNRHSPDSPQIQGYNHAYSNSPRSEAKKLVPTLETLRDAVNAGELDKLLKEAKSSRNFGRGR